jgi:hypothetical protein
MKPRQRDAGPHRIHHAAAVDHRLLAGRKIGRNGNKADREVLDAMSPQPTLQELDNVLAGHEPAGRKVGHEQLQRLFPVETGGELDHFSRRHAGRREGADFGADTGAGDGAHRYSVFGEHLQHTDVRNACRPAAAERQHKTRAIVVASFVGDGRDPLC